MGATKWRSGRVSRDRQSRGGDDRLSALGNDDTLFAGSGTDHIDGGSGYDYCLDGETHSSCEYIDVYETAPEQAAWMAWLGDAGVFMPRAVLIRPAGQSPVTGSGTRSRSYR